MLYNRNSCRFGISQVLVLAAIGCTWAARLDSSYLPPRGGSGSGAGFVQAPYRPGGGGFGGGGGGGGFGGGSFGGGSGANIPIIRYDNQPNRGDGSYSFR